MSGEPVEVSERDELLDDLVDAVLDYDTDRAVALARAGIAAGIPAHEVVADGLGAALQLIAELCDRGERFLVDLFNGGRVVDEALAALGPELELARAGREPEAVVVVGVIAPNIQDMGKKLLAIRFRAQGFEVVDLGVRVPPDAFARAVREHRADALAVTVMTNEGVGQLARVAAAVSGDDVFVLCGGAAASPSIAQHLGIRYGRDAAQAIDLVREHVAARP